MRNKNKSDIERVIRAPVTENSFNGFGLYIVVNATQIAGTSYRWLYKIKPAFLKGPLTSPDYAKAEIYANADPNGYDAISISELGNDMNSPRQYSYGVSENNLTGTFLPVRIPNQTPVIAMPYRCNDGQFRYIIINTQAINGDCP